tara:strand:+ start:938 stop:1372 length:435 start_codon:yes stop_codon:yes gene_type:complete
MKNNYENLDDALNIKSEIVSIKKSPLLKKKTSKDQALDVNDIQKDYEYTRTNLYSLIEKGQEAINGIMEIAEEGGSPRAYEVAGQLIKSVSDATDKLIDLQKKLKDIEDDSGGSTRNVTNNAVFVGSTSELSKLLKNGFINTKE